MTRSFVVRVYEICCWALGFVGARVRWEDVRLVVTSFIACWGARCCLQAHIRYRVKFVARVLECLLFASSCQLCYVVKFVAHLAPLQPHVARLLELSWGKGLVADLWNHQTLVLHFTTLLKGEGGTKQKPWFSLWQNSSFWRDVFQCRKKLEKRRRSTRYLPCMCQLFLLLGLFAGMVVCKFLSHAAEAPISSKKWCIRWKKSASASCSASFQGWPLLVALTGRPSTFVSRSSSGLRRLHA